MSNHDHKQRNSSPQAAGQGTRTSHAFVFLFGSDMEPGRVRARYPGARFAARARIPGGPGEYPWHPADDPANWPENESSLDVWGILLHLPAGTSPPIAPLRDVTTDDERQVEAFIGTDGSTVGDPAEILAAARYWELPPAYVRRLQSAIIPSGGASETRGPTDV